MKIVNQHPVDLSLLTLEEWQKLGEWNSTYLKYERRMGIHSLIEEQVRQTPHHSAIHVGNQQITYQELNERANQLAHYLRSLGVGPEVLVGICIERSLPMIIALLGILKAGGAYVPLDPKYPVDRLASIAEDAQFPVLITQSHLFDQLPPHQAQVVCLDRDALLIAQHAQCNPVNTVSPSNLAYVLYTSGSTGKPKGVALEHKNTVALIAWAKSYFTQHQLQGVLASTSLCFDLSVFEIFVPLSLGGKVILAQDALELPSLPAASDVTLINTVPSAIAALLRMQGIPQSVNTINLAGEPLQNALVQNLYQLSHIKYVFNLYGPTEDTTYSTVDLVPKGSENIPSIGHPIANTQVYLLEEPARRKNDPLKPVPIGKPGEVYIGGAGVARGYLNRPDLTAEKFIPDPFSNHPGARLYRTGDLAVYQPNGHLKYLGRIDHQIKIRGFRIELGEIEAVLNHHPEVQESVVVARPDSAGNNRLIAYVVPQSGSQTEKKPQGVSFGNQLKKWQTVWDETYSLPQGSYDPTFNITGWNNSITGLPIDAQTMLDYVNDTVERILALKPKRILEIGCGTGLLLFRIAPHCDRYVGLDLSPEAIRYVNKHLELQGENWSHVTVLPQAAHEVAEFAMERFDMVIINSVIQYFPGVDYLMQVLEPAIQLVEPGGTVFIGDVRDLSTLEMFHTWVQIHRSPDDLPCKQLRQTVTERVAQEKELVLHTHFFEALKHHIPRITHIETQLKRGYGNDELKNFRSDVILHIDTPIQTIAEYLCVDWQQDQFSMPKLHDLLRQQNPDLLKITHIPNARVATDVQALKILASSNCPETVQDLRAIIAQTSQRCCVHPEEMWSLSRNYPYRVSIAWSRSGTGDTYDVVLKHHSMDQTVLLEEQAIAPQPLATYANPPAQAPDESDRADLSLELRALVKDKLPDYMWPSTFVMMEAFPLNPNGKIDRRTLPNPKKERPATLTSYTAPSTPLEMQLAPIWTQVLDLDRVGIEDNFFELGGNSLLAVQLLMQVEDTLQVKLPLFYLLKEPTITGLIKGIEAVNHARVSNSAADGLERSIDCRAEAVLDTSIQPKHSFVYSEDEPRAIFLTGATGFLGAFLLDELLQQTQARIYCLVRASNLPDAYEKIKTNLKRYQLLHEDVAERIIPVLGDLAQPLLGLSESQFGALAASLDVIYHCGAFVNLVYPYTVLKPINVQGTQEIFRLASRGKITPVHYVSTVDIFQPLVSSGATFIPENQPLDPEHALDNGYAQSKWVAEQLGAIAQARGIPVSIYRPGMITGHSQTGVSQTNDLMCRLIKGMIQMGSAPDLDYSVNMTPVDYASKAIVHLSRQRSSLGKAFHILNPQTLPWNDLVRTLSQLGYSINLLPYQEWQAALSQAGHSQDNALSPIRSLLVDTSDKDKTYLEVFLMMSQAFDCQTTLRGLADTSIVCPSIDAKLLSTYLSFFNHSSFVIPPTQPPVLDSLSGEEGMVATPKHPNPVKVA